jgi:hypothetical protein
MGSGRLIGVRTSSLGGKFVTVGYLVAEQDATKAVDIIKRRIAKPTDEVVALNRVSEELLQALRIEPGEFSRADRRSFCGQTIIPIGNQSPAAA